VCPDHPAPSPQQDDEGLSRARERSSRKKRNALFFVTHSEKPEAASSGIGPFSLYIRHFRSIPLTKPQMRNEKTARAPFKVVLGYVRVSMGSLDLIKPFSFVFSALPPAAPRQSFILFFRLFLF